MFLMTSSPLQATEEFSDLPPVTPVGLLLFVSGLNVSFDTFKSSKDSQGERTCTSFCVCVCRHVKMRDKELLNVLSKNGSNFP